MPAAYATLLLSTPAPDVLQVTMNRPEAMNALNTQMMTDLRDCFMSFYVDADAARCIVLTGAGEKAFCAGADLKERNGMTDATWRRQHAIVEQAVRAIVDCPIPVLAAVNGAAFAGGCELALASDFIYAAEHARFAQTEVALGIIPGAMGTQNLPRAIGLRRAKELILTGRPFSAAEALAWGLANRVLPGPELMPAVIATATRIAENAPVAVRQAKKSVDKAGDLSRADGYQFEIEAYNRTVGTDDRREGIAAFNEKRKPKYQGM
jgi:enoyl-CoA hydratase/carnithine racemase